MISGWSPVFDRYRPRQVFNLLQDLLLFGRACRLVVSRGHRRTRRSVQSSRTGLRYQLNHHAWRNSNSSCNVASLLNLEQSFTHYSLYSSLSLKTVSKQGAVKGILYLGIDQTASNDLGLSSPHRARNLYSFFVRFFLDDLPWTTYRAAKTPQC